MAELVRLIEQHRRDHPADFDGREHYYMEHANLTAQLAAVPS